MWIPVWHQPVGKQEEMHISRWQNLQQQRSVYRLQHQHTTHNQSSLGSHLVWLFHDCWFNYNVNFECDIIIYGNLNKKIDAKYSHNTLQLDRTATQLIRIHPNGDDSNWIMLLRNRKQTFRFISCLLSGVIRGGKRAVLEELMEMKGKDIQSRCKYIRSQYIWPVQCGPLLRSTRDEGSSLTSTCLSKKMKSDEDSGKSMDKNAETGSRNHHTNSTENHLSLVDRQSEKELH